MSRTANSAYPPCLCRRPETLCRLVLAADLASLSRPPDGRVVHHSSRVRHGQTSYQASTVSTIERRQRGCRLTARIGISPRALWHPQPPRFPVPAEGSHSAGRPGRHAGGPGSRFSARRRDRAILLLGFAGGERRSEITGADLGRDQMEDGRGCIEILDKGLLLTLRGKTGWRREVESAAGRRMRPAPSSPSRPGPSSSGLPIGPLFRRVTGQGKSVGRERLNDKEVAPGQAGRIWPPAFAAICAK
ncbi:hypothetical protein PMI09_04784 [Rhizobium sp. CF122]|nr:hypothetical protein PMI09_04784 [Rhizobium sp. CF122]